MNWIEKNDTFLKTCLVIIPKDIDLILMFIANYLSQCGVSVTSSDAPCSHL